MFHKAQTRTPTKAGIIGNAIRTMGKLCFAIVAIVALFPAATSQAASRIVYVSATGSGTSCTATLPCATITDAVDAVVTAGDGRVVCLNGVADDGSISIAAPNLTLQVDCPQAAYGNFGFTASNMTVWIRHLTLKFFADNQSDALLFTGSGSLILEDCVIDGYSTSTAILIQPNGPLNLVIRNSRISNNVGGILLKPAAGGSINATLDQVTIVDNTPGGGLKIDTTNGPVTVDITDSVISGNGAHGVNAVGNPGGQAMVSIKNSVIAKNGQDGVVANGANAGVLVQTTLLDQNVAGATLVASGGHISTYGNNSIVGSAGSGFTGPAPLQ